MPDCDVCRNLITAALGHSVLKAFAMICADAEHGCSFCLILRDAVSAFEDPAAVQDVYLFTGDEEYNQARLGRRLPLEVTCRLDGGWKESGSFEVYCANESVAKRWPFVPVRAHISSDASSPECLNQARKWLDNCLHNHATADCRKQMQSELPTRVICVRDSFNDPFIYETTPGETGEYAALSYCWGRGKTLTTTRSTYVDHKKRIPLHELPRTCRDAVVVARALDISFLWIDSLCIIQDCATDWEYEAARMCSVYENALVTLAALDAPDNDAGLFMTSPIRKTEKLSFASSNGITSHVYVRRKYRQRGVKPFLHSCTEVNALESRGWTFQELTLAPRILWFTPAELGWQCLAETACECDPEPTREYVSMESTAIRSALRRSNSSWKHIWRRLVEEYAQRKLTRQTDRLPALSGLAKAVHRHLESNDEYLFGLWRNDLDRQLLWSSCCKYPNSAPDCSRIELTSGSDYVPSWSWASVTGPLIFWRHHPMKDQEWPFMWRILDLRIFKTSLNPYGPGTGRISIEGSLIQLEMKERKPTIPGASYRVEFSPDPTYLDPRSLEEQTLFLLVAVSGKFNKIPSCVGLVLIRLHGPEVQLFRRAGLLHVLTTASNIDSEWDKWLNEVTSSRKQFYFI